MMSAPTIPGTREPDAELLHAFLSTRGEEAFAELARRHAGWIEGVAARSLGDRELAREVTQNVFILLARKVARVKPDALGPWLHRTTVLECRNARRREQRRQRTLVALERAANSMDPVIAPLDPEWRDALPLLDAAVNHLPERDRAVVVQRFIEQRSWREIARSTGRSENAARMALGPALERLQSLLRRRGVALPVAALLAALSATLSPSGTVSAATLTEQALSLRLSTGPRADGGLWLSTAACVVVGTVAGYGLSEPPEAVEKTVERRVDSRAGGLPGLQAAPGEDGMGFDLEAVLRDLHALKPSGNDMASLVRLRAALRRMPAEAVPRLLDAMRKRGWGPDSADIAAVFFERWAGMDVEAVWAVFRETDFLGAVEQTTLAILRGMRRDDPALFVKLINTLPLSNVYETAVREAVHFYFGNLPVDEIAPLLRDIKSPGARSVAMQNFLARDLSGQECALLAPMAAEQPPQVVGRFVTPLAEKWARRDWQTFQLWAETLPVNSPARFAAVAGGAAGLSPEDPIRAGNLIRDLPWSPAWNTELSNVAVAWVKADPAGAGRWLETSTMIPPNILKSLKAMCVEAAANRP